MSLGVNDDGYDVNLPPVGGQFAAAASGNEIDTELNNIIGKDKKFRTMSLDIASLIGKDISGSLRSEMARVASLSDDGTHITGKASGSAFQKAAGLLRKAEEQGMPDLADMRNRLNGALAARGAFVPSRKRSTFDLN